MGLISSQCCCSCCIVHGNTGNGGSENGSLGCLGERKKKKPRLTKAHVSCLGSSPENDVDLWLKWPSPMLSTSLRVCMPRRQALWQWLLWARETNWITSWVFLLRYKIQSECPYKQLFLIKFLQMWNKSWGQSTELIYSLLSELLNWKELVLSPIAWSLF